MSRLAIAENNSCRDSAASFADTWKRFRYFCTEVLQQAARERTQLHKPTAS
jgi:hypothetical protein